MLVLLTDDLLHTNTNAVANKTARERLTFETSRNQSKSLDVTAIGLSDRIPLEVDSMYDHSVAL